VSRVRPALVQIYEFIAGDPVILAGVALAFAATAALVRGAGVDGVAAGVVMVAAVVAVLALSLLRERRPAGR
jgi:hypothetical protein